MGMMSNTTVDFGSTPVDEATFPVVDAGLSGLTKAEIFVMRDATGDNDADAHMVLATFWRFIGSISGTTLTIEGNAWGVLTTGTFVLHWVAN